MQAFLLNHPGFAVSLIVLLGIGSQWIANRLGLPSILVLLTTGFLVSPAGFGILLPEKLLGNDDMFFALISLSVAVILFEGGLTLKMDELREIATPLYALIFVGGLLTLSLATLAGWALLGLSLKLATLFGSILVVTGPTVIMPLLRQVRPTGRVASIVKWEGILNDPVGATLAVLVLEVIISDRPGTAGALGHILMGVSKTVVIGVGLGALGAFFIVKMFHNHFVPEYLEGVFSLSVALALFSVSNLLQHESGLLTVTLLGILIANQSKVPVKHLIEFKEHLGVLLISVLFIVLAARLTPEKLAVIDAGVVGFIAVLIVIVRPVAVFVALAGTEFDWREKLFVSWMAPRGIVAAAVTSLFALELVNHGIAEAAKLESLIFAVIIGTVAIYGLGAGPLARYLGLAQQNPQGLLIMGAHSWARQIAAAVQRAGFPVHMVDTNRRNIYLARMEGIPGTQGNIISEKLTHSLDLNGIGRFIALTRNDEANSLGTLSISEEFGRNSVFQIEAEGTEATSDRTLPASHLHGRLLFGPRASFGFIQKRMEMGATIKTTRLSEEFDWQAFQSLYGETCLPLFIVRSETQLEVVVTDIPQEPEIGQSIIALVDPGENDPESRRLDRRLKRSLESSGRDEAASGDADKAGEAKDAAAVAKDAAADAKDEAADARDAAADARDAAVDSKDAADDARDAAVDSKDAAAEAKEAAVDAKDASTDARSAGEADAG